MTDTGHHNGWGWREDGDRAGRPLVLLHSLGSTSELWAPQIAGLSDRRVVRVDFPGHGRSKAASGHRTSAALADGVLAVLEHRGVDAFDLCGLSLGGLVALELASRPEPRVRSLVACATAARVGTRERWQARIDEVRVGGLEAAAQVVRAHFFSQRFGTDHPDVVARAKATLLDCGVDGYLDACRSLRDADLRPRMGDIRVPTLLVAGDEDSRTPVETMRNQLEAPIPDAELVVLPGAGHLLNVEAPSAFLTHLRRFLDRTERA